MIGTQWRVLAWKGEEKCEYAYSTSDGVQFDELVVDDLIHIEKLNESAYWVQIADKTLVVRRERDKASVYVQTSWDARPVR